MKNLLLVLVAALFVLPAQARPRPVDGDAECVAALLMVPQFRKKMPELEKVLTDQQVLVAMMYFVGKIEARNAKFDLESALFKTLSGLTTGDAAKMLKRCGAELDRKQKYLTDVSESLLKRSGGE